MPALRTIFKYAIFGLPALSVVSCVAIGWSGWAPPSDYYLELEGCQFYQRPRVLMGSFDLPKEQCALIKETRSSVLNFELDPVSGKILSKKIRGRSIYVVINMKPSPNPNGYEQNHLRSLREGRKVGNVLLILKDGDSALVTPALTGWIALRVHDKRDMRYAHDYSRSSLQWADDAVTAFLRKLK